MEYGQERLLRRAEVEDLTGLSKSGLYELIAAGRFPRPVRVGIQAVRWRASEIAAWQKALPRAGASGKRAGTERGGRESALPQSHRTQFRTQPKTHTGTQPLSPGKVR
ncbi:MAG: AlpA family phage regulatory protein [Alphaproteobacteria bacterium]|nr:MAG: AlpA family phage regulatory protein [Alphaproteobacteria bacterium]